MAALFVGVVQCNKIMSYNRRGLSIRPVIATQKSHTTRENRRIIKFQQEEALFYILIYYSFDFSLAVTLFAGVCVYMGH